MSKPAEFEPQGPAVSRHWPGSIEHEPIEMSRAEFDRLYQCNFEPSPELGRAWLEGLEDEDEHK